MTSEVEASETVQGGFQGQIPAVEPLLTEFIVTLALAAHTYLTESGEERSAIADAEIAIDVAGATFERVKDRLRPDQRLAITQMLTETRMTFVRKRGI